MSSRLLRILENLLAIGLLAIALTVVTQVFLSSVFGSSIIGANEIITKLFIYLTTIGSAVAVGRREHISIMFARETLPIKVERLVEALCVLLVAALNAIVLIYSFRWIETTGHYLMPTTQLPRSVAQLSIPVGAALAILFCIVRLFSSSVASKTEPE